MSKRTVLQWALAVIALVTVFAPVAGASAESTSSGNIHDTAVRLRSTDTTGSETQQPSNGVELLINDPHYDASRQTAAMEDFVTQGRRYHLGGVRPCRYRASSKGGSW